MKLVVVAVGQRVPDWAQTAWDDYAKRFPPELKLELRAVKTEPRSSKTVEAIHAAERERDAVAAKHAALGMTLEQKDGSSEVRSAQLAGIKGLLAESVSIEKGYEVAVAVALGTLSDAIVVRDLNSAISALTTMRSENLGQADVLVYEPGSHNSTSVPAGLTALTSHVRSSEISELLASLLSNTVVAESAREAEGIIRSHPSVTVVTRDGDLITKFRARGGAKSASSLVEIQAIITEVETELEKANHEVERLTFELSNATDSLSNKQSEYDQALAKLNDSDARISALTEQLAVASQN